MSENGSSSVQYLCTREVWFEQCCYWKAVQTTISVHFRVFLLCVCVQFYPNGERGNVHTFWCNKIEAKVIICHWTLCLLSLNTWEIMLIVMIIRTFRRWLIFHSMTNETEDFGHGDRMTVKIFFFFFFIINFFLSYITICFNGKIMYKETSVGHFCSFCNMLKTSWIWDQEMKIRQ